MGKRGKLLSLPLQRPPTQAIRAASKETLSLVIFFGTIRESTGFVHRICKYYSIHQKKAFIIKSIDKS